MNFNRDKDRVLNAVMEKIGVDYEVIDYIGGGGLSKIYSVNHKFSNKRRALKIMDVDYLTQIFAKTGVRDIKEKFENIKERFITEARIFDRITHPNIAGMYEISFVNDEQRQIGIPYLIMEFIDGITMRDLLKKESPLDFERIIRIAEDLLPALSEIHNANIIHRDIKPANIMIAKNSGKAVLIDFGLAEDRTDSSSSTVGAVMGTPAYIAPEIITRSKAPSPGSDIYSFGVVLYEMVAGEKPFEGGNQLELIYDQLSFSVPNLTKLNPKIPPGIRKIIEKAMAKDPDDRYRSADELLAALRKLKEDIKNSGRKRLYRYLASSFIIIALAAFFTINYLIKVELLKSMPADVQAVYEIVKKTSPNEQKAWETDFGDGIIMVYIPFVNGLPGFWMGKTEVTVGQYMKFVNETQANYPEWKEKDSRFNLETGTDKFYANQTANDFPIVGISRANAEAYCRWLSAKTGLNFKLPSGKQWQSAARGTDNRLYPWGTTLPDNNLANFGSMDRKTTKVGSFPAGASPYGLLDMAGNVEEMCDDDVARGGSFYSNDKYIQCDSQNQYDPSTRTNALGFRLCMVTKK